MLREVKYSGACSLDNVLTRVTQAGWQRVTKNYAADPKYQVTEAEHFFPSRETVIDFGGSANGELTALTPDRLRIAYQADGARRHSGNYRYTFHFSKERKIQRLKSILTACQISYEESRYDNGTTNIFANVGVELSKDFCDISLADKSSTWCLKVLLESAQYWEGRRTIKLIS